MQINVAVICSEPSRSPNIVVLSLFRRYLRVCCGGIWDELTEAVGRIFEGGVNMY